MLPVFLLCFIFSEGKAASWQPEMTNLHIHFEHYAGNVQTEHAFKSVLASVIHDCVSECFVNENSSFYFLRNQSLCYCFSEKLDLDINSVTGDTSRVYGYYTSGYQMTTSGTFTKWNTFSKHKDCLSLFVSGFIEDGVYIIYPSQETGVGAWCDMTNGGWTVIQRRQDGSVDFYRPWGDYAQGFGNVTGEYWLGLDNIHKLTQGSSSLYIEMYSFGDVTPSSAFAHYTSFSIDDVTNDYMLHVDGFHGDCGDSFYYHNGRRFSTLDRDNDVLSVYNCAVQYSGAWWYATCHKSNLNGLYLHGTHTSYADGINWWSCWGHYYSLKTVIMTIRRNQV